MPLDRGKREDRIETTIAKAPPQDLRNAESQIEQISNRIKARAITLTEEIVQKLQTELQVIIQNWRDSRTGLKTKLRQWNDQYEGVVKVTNFPWPGASHLDVPLTKIKAREIRSTINRSTMRPKPFLMVNYSGPSTLRSEKSELAKDIEAFLEDKIKNATNVHQTLKDALIPIFRDGTCPVQVTWDTQWETVFDFKTYESADDFTADYPSPQDAKIAEDQYGRIIEKLQNGEPHEIQYEYDVATYDGPRAYLVPLIDFVHYPVYISDLDETVCHGKRVWFTDYQLQHMAVTGKFKDKEMVDQLIAGAGDVRDDDISKSRDSIDGIDRSFQPDNAKEFEFFELTYLTSLTEADKKKGIRRKYLVYYREKTNQLFRVENYPIRKGRSVYFILRYIRRDNRLLGMSLVADIEDLSQEVNIIHRQRINSRTITHVPSFKAKMSARDKFDPSVTQYQFRPGVTFWLRNMDDVEQFDIRPVDLSGSTDDELLLFQLVDLVTGSSSGLSGQANPIDPRAPARKQEQMNRMSSNRIDDYVEPLMPVFSKIGQHMTDLYYQFGSKRIKFYAEENDGVAIEKEMEKSKLFNPNVMFVVKGTSLFDSPEREFGLNEEIYTILGTDPITQQNVRIRRNMLQRLLSASRIQDEKSLLPTRKEIMTQFQIDIDVGGSIPTIEEQEREAKTKLQQEKAASRLQEGEMKAQVQIETEGIRQIAAVEREAAKPVAQPAGTP